MIENIIVTFSVIISYCCYIFLFKLITKSQMHINIKNAFIIILLILISRIPELNKIIIFNLLMSLFIIFTELILIFKIEMKKSIYYSVYFSLISLLCDAIFSMFLNNKYLINFIEFQKNAIFRSILVVPVMLLQYCICLIPLIRHSVEKFYNKFFKNKIITKINILFFGAIVLIILIVFALNGYNKVNRIGHFITILCVLTFIIMFFVFLYLMYREFQINQVNRKIIEENKYIKSIAKQDEEFKHNLINNLLGIKTVSNKKTNKLIDELINDYRQDYKNITNINDLPNGVQSIIYRKAYEENIEDLNLVVNNSIDKELYDILNPKKYNHLCTSIGILFDNALQAVKDVEEKVIEISFLEDSENVYFILKNSFSNFIDLEEVGKKNVTTKNDGHGIGVNYISNLKTVNVKNEIINNMFVSKLIISKIKKI